LGASNGTPAQPEAASAKTIAHTPAGFRDDNRHRETVPAHPLDSATCCGFDIEEI
jgi:hypothetical protein